MSSKTICGADYGTCKEFFYKKAGFVTVEMAPWRKLFVACFFTKKVKKVEVEAF